MADPSYPADATWEDLPPHVRSDLQARGRAVPGDGRFDEPPYPLGGMQAVMRRVVYPSSARRDGVEGRVVVVATIDPQGHVETAGVLSPVHPDLDRAAVDAVRESSFRPAVRDGRPVEARVAIPFRFQLESASPWWWPFAC